MGSYTKNLYKKGRTQPKRFNGAKPKPADNEHLVECGIMRGGVLHKGHRSHYAIRRELGDEKPLEKMAGDEEGFITSTGRFVSRREGMIVGFEAGQCPMMGRELLSSDIW